MEWATGTQTQHLGATILALSFHAFTVILISLILPLSFLLLARLSTAQSLLFLPPSSLSTIILSLLIDTTPPLIHAYVLSICVATLLCLLGGSTPRFHLCVSWVFLCVLQLGVGLGIEATIAADVEQPVQICADSYAKLLRRVLFLVGLHEAMLFWSRAVVRPVVDDTVFGVATEEWGVERVVTGAAFVGLWWWKLKNEVEGLVGVEVGVGMGVVDFIGWLVYYITVAVGVVRFVKGCVWLHKRLLLKEPKGDIAFPYQDDAKV